MLLGLCLIVVTLLGGGLAAVATRPARGSAPGFSRPPDRDRRLRRLYRDPDRVTLLDIEHLLLAESVPQQTVARVLARAAQLRLTARTMWRWADAHGAARLVTVLDAGLAEDTLLDHLDAGTAPDWTTLDVFAGLAADTLPGDIPIAELIDLDDVPDPDELTYPGDLADWSTLSPDPLELRQFDNLPPITGPGLSPYRPVSWLDGDEGVDGDDGWPSAAA